MNRCIVEVDVSPWKDNLWGDGKISLEGAIGIALNSYAVTEEPKFAYLDGVDHMVFTVEDVKPNMVNGGTMTEIYKAAQRLNGISAVHIKAWLVSEWLDQKFPAPKEKQ